MVPQSLRPLAGARLACAVVASLALVASAASAHDGEACPTKRPVGEYESDGEVREYVTEEIPEYVTGEIPEYVTKEIPEYHPHADGAYISDSFPPDVVGQAYVEVKPGYFALVRGLSGRAYARHARLISRLAGDRLITYMSYGFPAYRHYENDQERMTEHWTYPEDDITYIFCGDRLVKTQAY